MIAEFAQCNKTYHHIKERTEEPNLITDPEYIKHSHIMAELYETSFEKYKHIFHKILCFLPSPEKLFSNIYGINQKICTKFDSNPIIVPPKKSETVPENDTVFTKLNILLILFICLVSIALIFTCFYYVMRPKLKLKKHKKVARNAFQKLEESDVDDLNLESLQINSHYFNYNAESGEAPESLQRDASKKLILAPKYNAKNNSDKAVML